MGEQSPEGAIRRLQAAGIFASRLLLLEPMAAIPTPRSP